MDRMENLVWFSHVGAEYEVREIGQKKFVKFEERKIFDWDNCNIRISQSPVKKLRVFIRGHQYKYSEYNKKIVRPIFLLIIDIDSISKVYEEPYQIGSEREDLKSLQSKRYLRYVFRLDNYWIWEWRKKYSDIQESRVYSIYEQIKAFVDGTIYSKVGTDNIIVEAIPHVEKGVSPVIYQPAIDKLENFVREIHCSKRYEAHESSILEVSIMFNNEQLRRHRIVNGLYERFRLFFYGRKIDVETFRIYFSTEKSSDNYFTFEGIYSGPFGIVEDSIHGDNKAPPPRRNILSYFMDNFHPVVFINTSNHAMSEMDNNLTLWKWEYQPFEEKSPVIFGIKSRKEIDNEFASIFARFLRLKGTNNYQLAERQNKTNFQ
jgi:hypothetical protein